MMVGRQDPATTPVTAIPMPQPQQDRRARIDALVVALLAAQPDLGLLEEETGFQSPQAVDPRGGAGWLERNRRLVRRYQALVRTAVTLDALIEQEMASDQLAGS